MFVLIDGQNIADDDLKFTYVELHERLAQLVTNKVWESKAAERMNLY